MARSDSFFIRATVPVGTAFDQTSIDLGSFVDALGKTVMRIHNVSVQYGSGAVDIAGSASSAETNAFWQLTTQSQGSLLTADNRSVISTGALRAFSDPTGNVTALSESTDLNPQDWSGGYLVAVESIFLGSQAVTLAVTQVQVVLECTVETMTASASMALALSQQ